MSWKTLYQGFFTFFERFGHMLSRLLLTVLYFLFVTPAGVFITLFGDSLRIRKPVNSNWRKVTVDMRDRKRARSQI